jgi:multisubunit Na+/H+ antiporter MnhG subunit
VAGPEPRTVVVVGLILVAHLVTSPLSGLALGRAAYRSGTARPPVTRVDEPAARANRREAARSAEPPGHAPTHGAGSP